MMRLPGKISHSLIGVDIGVASIKAMQLQSARTGGWSVKRAASLLRKEAGAPLTGAEASRFADVLERQGFRGREVVLAAPGAALLVDVLDLPPRDSGAPIEALAAEEVARSHKLELGSFSLAVWDLPVGQRGSGGASAMSVGLRYIDAAAMLDPLESAGLVVAAIDSPAAAFARASHHPKSTVPSIRAILDLGCSAATLVLVAGDVVIYQRRITDAGLATLTAALLSDLHVGPDEANHLLQEVGVAESSTQGAAASRIRGIILRHLESLNGEIESGLQYAKHRHPAMSCDELLLAGGGALIRDIGLLLSARLDIPTRPLNGRAGLDVATPATNPVLAQAFGLALYGAP